MKIRIALFLFTVLLLSGCGNITETGESAAAEISDEIGLTEIPAEAGYTQISAEEAKTMMDEQEESIILDVREASEYDESHITHAVLLPVGSIDAERASAVIPEMDSVVLVYCRSGNRSKTAAQKLAELGYTQVYEFGGIIDWPYDTESSE